MPILNTPPEPSDAAWLRDLYRRWDAEEELYLQQEHRRQGIDEGRSEVERWRGDHELRWYSSLNFFEQAVEEAYTFGERIPVGTWEDRRGEIHLLYSDDELSLLDLESDEESEEVTQ